MFLILKSHRPSVPFFVLQLSFFIYLHLNFSHKSRWQLCGVDEVVMKTFQPM